MTYFSADEVDEICDRMRAEHYPCDVIHLDTAGSVPIGSANGNSMKNGSPIRKDSSGG